MAEKKCNNCGTNYDMAVMPIAQHEKDQNRLNGIIKWLISVVALLVMLLVGTNIGMKAQWKLLLKLPKQLQQLMKISNKQQKLAVIILLAVIM